MGLVGDGVVVLGPNQDLLVATGSRAGTVNAVFSELVQDKFPFSAKVPERLENERFGTKLKIFRNILSNIL